MGNRAGSIPALGTRRKWLALVNPLGGLRRLALPPLTSANSLRLGLRQLTMRIEDLLTKGQAGDLNIRYHSEQAKCPESNAKGGVSNDYRSCKRR